MDIKRKIGIQAGSVILLSALAAIAIAQDFGMHRSSASRAGVPTLSASTAPATLPSAYNNIGRGFLRWWHPLQDIRTFLDNDDTIVGTPGGTAIPSGGTWTSPDPLPVGIGALTYAMNFDTKPGLTPYRMARTVAQTLNTTDPTNGATATYTWQFNNLVAGQEYQLFVNIPIGPTATASPAAASDFPQQHYVFRVTGAAQPDDEVIDTFATGGGLIRLGEDGAVTDKLYVPIGNTLTITLYNTCPRGGDGGFLDPQAAPGAEWVYADSAYLSTSNVSEGAVQAQPVVRELSQAPPTGASVLNAVFNRRVVSARNQEFVAGELGRQVPLANISSHFYNGMAYDGSLGVPASPTESERLNVAWSWPAMLPINSLQAESQRYNTDRRDWIFGPIAGNERHTFRTAQDNLAATTAASGSFVSDTALTTFRGGDYFTSPSVVGAPTGAVNYVSNIPNGNYRIQAWMPDADPPGTLSQSVRYNIYRGAVLVDTLTVNQSIGNGWLTLPGQPDDGYVNDIATGRLRVEVTNQGDVADAGRPVFADAIRFIADADLSVNTSPIFTSATINDGGLVGRDVVVVPMEDGRIYCVDAHGDRIAGTPPQVYWTYPSDNPASDPNNALTEDGRASEMPTGFNTSSGLVVTIAGEDLLFIASENGRVYCIEMAGRGDGTTRRRWTWPDDYQPDNPLAARQQPREPIIGSLSYDAVNNLILVPTAEGRVVALNATGNAASRTTNEVWQFPALIDAPLGTLTHAPVVAQGQVFFGAPNAVGSTDSEVYSIDPATGLLNWRTGLTTAGVFANFGASGPAPVDGAVIIGGGAFANIDAVFVADSAGRVASLESATGNQQWSTTELTSGACASPTFTHLTAYNSISVLQTDTPAIIVPTFSGGLVGMLIDGTTNSAGRRRVWQYDVQTGPPTGVAMGGWQTGDLRSWMYVGDADGLLYAFNGNNDSNPGVITPGEEPGFDVIEEDDPDDVLNTALDPNKIILLAPEGYDLMQQQIVDGTLTDADVTNYVANYSVVRRTFEIGESLYILAYDLPDLGSTSTGTYIAEVRVNSPTGSSSTQARQVQVRDVSGGAPPTKVMLTAVPLLATGRSAIVPGPSSVTVRLIPTGRRNTSSTETGLSPAGSDGAILVANPLSLVFNRVGLTVGAGANSVGNTPDATDIMNSVNGSPGVDPASSANGPIKETMVGPKPGAYFGPEAVSAGDVVSHAGVGVMDVRVRDRSLSFLVFGPGRGLQNVRLGGQDVVWQVNDLGGGMNTVQNRYKPLSDNGLVYPGFEDAPTLEPNFSLDYPDISRNALLASKSAFGRVENPFFTGVQLNPPQTTDPDITAYRTQAGFEAQLNRTLSDTMFNVRLNVPRFQPASGPAGLAVSGRPGYRGQAFVYVDAGAAGLDGTDANRDFAVGVRVAPDERLTLATPTIDLGSMPGGAGYNGGPVLGGPGGRGPLDPSNPASAFRPWNTTEFDAQFEPYGVLNEGNVNMLNVRTAKALDDTTNGITRRYRPLELFAPGLHELAWLDAAVHMHTSLDPNYANTGRAGFDGNARMILQKARPGDLVPTRLSVNPVRRVNANVGSTGGTLLDSILFPPGDPQVGISAPIGTPVGEYIRDIFVFEDTLGTNQTAAVPSLGPAIDLGGFLNNDVYEPYSNPPLTLKFTLRESRLTNRATSKSSPNVDNLITGAEDFFWGNRQPTGYRTHRGDLFVAWSSNRVTTEADFQGGVLIPNKTAADTANQDNWRIYLSVLRGTTPGAINGANGPMPMRDLNLWGSPANQWFSNRLAVPGDGVAPTTVFTFNDPNTPGGNEYGTPIAGTERYFSPAFPTNGSFNAFSAATTDGIMMAFLGEVDTAGTGNDRRTMNEIIIAEFDTSDPSNLTTPSSLSAMPYDVWTKKTTPAIVQSGNTATVVYGAASGGNPQLYYAIFNGNWTAPRPLLGNANLTGVNSFDRVGNASAQLRSYRNSGNVGRLDISFTARRRGRANAEAFMATLNTNGNGVPVNAGPGLPPAVPFGPRIDAIAVDAATGTYWAPGAVWRTTNADLNTASANRLDLMRLQGGAYVSILDHTTRYFDADTSILTYKTSFGGNVTIDPNTGSVKFSGAAIPRGTRLFVRYAPYYLVTSQSGNVNYRSASMVWDDRLIGVYVDATNPSRNLLGDLRYWRTPGNLPISNANDPIRNARFILAYSRTSGDGGRPTRPALRTMRFGVQLPTAIALDANGDPVFLQLTGSPGNYQIDAANGRIYFESGAEDQNATINYRGVDGAGALLGATGNVVYPVNLISETSEEDIPIEQAANESDMFISLDPQNFDNTARRPGLLWLFWTSTRAGGDDVFYETIAPRFAPRPPAP